MKIRRLPEREAELRALHARGLSRDAIAAVPVQPTLFDAKEL
jgi:hypothetical protein